MRETTTKPPALDLGSLATAGTQEGEEWLAHEEKLLPLGEVGRGCGKSYSTIIYGTWESLDMKRQTDVRMICYCKMREAIEGI